MNGLMLRLDKDGNVCRLDRIKYGHWTLLTFEPEFLPNPTKHPARFPIDLPSFFINLLTEPGQLILDPFAGMCTTAVAAEQLDRRWLMTELDRKYTAILPRRLAEGR